MNDLPHLFCIDTKVIMGDQISEIFDLLPIELRILDFKLWGKPVHHLPNHHEVHQCCVKIIELWKYSSAEWSSEI